MSTQALGESLARSFYVTALRAAAEQARWNITHREDAPDSLDLDYQRHWRATAVWLEKRADAIDQGKEPDDGYRPATDPDSGETA